MKEKASGSAAAPPASSSSSPFKFEWVSVDRQTRITYDPEQTASLARKFDLCVSGFVVEKMLEQEGMAYIEGSIRFIKVFARFSPSQKELVLLSLKGHGLTTLMCGDGTNDVGALKQAHVGVALISSSNLIPLSSIQQGHHQNHQNRKQPFSSSSSSELRRRGSARAGKIHPRARGRKQPGAVPPPQITPAETGAGRGGGGMREEKKVKVFGMELDLEEEQELGIIRLGDASIAAPFTSKRPYVSAVAHIIRQGRCALVTTYQMFRILALNCLVSAYSMSVLYLDGVKYGDTQMTVASLAITLFFFFISRSTPLKQLSAERPAARLFEVGFFVEIMGQFAVHMVTLLTAVAWAMPHTPRDKETLDPDGLFKPNVLNTVVFLISTSMTVATFLANYRGHPFMISLRENKLLLYSLLSTELLLLVCALDFLRPLNYLMELAPMPTVQFGLSIFGLMVADLTVAVGFTWAVRGAFANVPRPSDR